MSCRWHITLVAQHWDGQRVCGKGCTYFVPLVQTQCIEVCEIGKPGPSSICNYDIQPAKLLDGFVHNTDVVFWFASVLSRSARERLVMGSYPLSYECFDT